MKRSRKPRGRTTSSSTISSQSAPLGGVASSAALTLAHLPAPGAGGTRCRSTVVAGAGELAPQPRDRAQVLGPRDADDVHAAHRPAPRRAGEREPPAQPRQARPEILHRADQRAPPPERAGAAGEIVGIGRARRRRRRIERLEHAPPRSRRQRDADPAPPPHDVPHAAAERAQLGREGGRRERDGSRREAGRRRGRGVSGRRRRAKPSAALGRRRRGLSRLMDVVAARGAAAEVLRAGEGAELRVAAGAAMVDARRGDVADAPAGGAQAALPVLLVAGAAERLVERADPLDRAAAQGHVRAPHELGVAVLLAEVERRHRQRLAPARAQLRSLQSRPDRPAERVVLRGRAEQRVEPARPDLDVVVEEAQQLTARGRRPPRCGRR